MAYRLLKVMCQAVLVGEDEDGHLVERVADAVMVPAAEWAGYPERLYRQLTDLNHNGDGS